MALRGAEKFRSGVSASPRVRQIAVAATAAALVLCLFGGAAANARTSSNQASPAHALGVAKTAPKLTCNISSITLEGKQVIPTGGCKIGAKPAPASWTWATKSADLSGAPCAFGTASGSGRNTSLPLTPAGLSGSGNVLLPAQYAATFTVKAKVGKQTKLASRTHRVKTVNSGVLCGAPPKLVSLPDASPSACTLPEGGVTYNGLFVHVNTIACVGDGPCSWHPARPFPRSGVLDIGYTFSCSQVGYTGWLTFSSFYGSQAMYCPFGGADGTSSYVVQPQWGPEGIDLQAQVNTFSNGQELPLSKDIGNLWEIGWLQMHGNTPPCTPNVP